MVSFEIFVKAMPPSLSELKVTPSFCFPIKIRDDRTASNGYVSFSNKFSLFQLKRMLQVTKKVAYGKMNHKSAIKSYQIVLFI